ncbi:hypothetical protein GOP47_0028814 [Adiantum capillus-veneris]|nr:hypothetical protein GOP47_0028814 [Adiantum capillus-veneris]
MASTWVSSVHHTRRYENLVLSRNGEEVSNYLLYPYFLVILIKPMLLTLNFSSIGHLYPINPPTKTLVRSSCTPWGRTIFATNEVEIIFDPLPPTTWDEGET